MSLSRWADASFRSSVDVRQQANEPAQLTLVRRGVYKGVYNGTEEEALADSMCEVHKQHPELGSIEIFKQAIAAFPFPEEMAKHLSRNQMEAIHAYTLETPKYYKVLNDRLYNTENEQHEPQLNAWLPFLLHFTGGLSRLREHQQEKPRQLRRVCQIPKTIWEEHFTERNQDKSRLFRAALSTSSSSDESMFDSFLVMNKAASDKVAVQFEFDEWASREAVCIQRLSAVFAEEEWLFPPFYRARAVGDPEPITLGSGSFARKGFKVRLTSLHRLPPIPAMLDWNGSISISKILALMALLIEHMQGDLRTTLMGAFNKFEMWCGLACPDKTGGEQEVEGKDDSDDIRQRVTSANDIRKVLGSTKREETLEERLQRELELISTINPWLELLKSVGAPELVEAERRYKTAQTLQEYRGCIGAWAAQDAQEAEHIRQLAITFIGIGRVECVLRGQEGTLAEVLWETRLPLSPDALACEGLPPAELLESLKQTVYFQGGGMVEREYLHPVVAAIEKRQVVLAAPPAELGPDDAAKCLLAYLDHLRLVMSRYRVLLLLGLRGSGKSTVAKTAFGLQAQDVTKTLAFSRCDDLEDVLIVDTPGFCQTIEARNDFVRLALSFADIRGLLRVLVVAESGQEATVTHETMKKEIAELRDKAVPVDVVFTQADERYKAAVIKKLREERNPPDREHFEEWLRKLDVTAIAEAIRNEDRGILKSGGFLKEDEIGDPTYVCFSGFFTREETGTKPKITFLEEPPPKAMIQGFHEAFNDNLQSAEELKRRLLASFRDV